MSSLVYLRAFLSPGLVGLAFTYARNVDGGLANIVRQWSYVEIIMVSPERVMEYASLPPEGKHNMLIQVEPAAGWPRGGAVVYDNVVFSYKESGDEAVLKNVSFSIKSNKKVGVVGRTGAGSRVCFSVGERQLRCMGRALLSRSRIVVMDEATAAIDHATEQRLQEMITREFQDATVLTIAHRLATVLESDRILVLNEGEVVEFDTPQSLVKDSEGVFYELAKEGGYLHKLRA